MSSRLTREGGSFCWRPLRWRLLGSESPGLVLVAMALLAAVPAALWTVALWDRTALTEMSIRWAATFLVLAIFAIAWLWATIRQLGPSSAALAMAPSVVLSGAALAAVYLSETAHHAWLFQPEWKAAGVSLTAGLFLAVPAIGRGWEGAQGYLAAHRRAIVALTLGAAGVCQALSLSHVTMDDAIRYWAVADGVLGGHGYPVTTGAAGGSGFYLVELPVYPLLLAAGFLAIGHRFLALHLPLVVANLVLPYALYGLARAAGAGRMRALQLALIVLSVPYYQTFALGAAQPEPLLAAELAAALWLAMLRLNHLRDGAGGRWWEWPALGLCSAAAVLTRPEGVLYVAPLWLGLLWTHFRSARGGLALGLASAGVPVLAFSLFLLGTLGIVWPAGWTNVAEPRFFLPNVQLVLGQDLPYYVLAAGLPAPDGTGLLLAGGLGAVVLAGLTRLCLRQPDLWFIPLALGLNLVVIFLSPTYLTIDLFSPPTFFRHFSVLFPWLVPALAAWPRLTGAARMAARLAATGVLLWELSLLGAATQRTLAGQPSVLTADVYVLISDLWQADDALPALPFSRGGDGIPVVDPGFDYMGFRSGLYARLKPYDQHTNDAGRAHMLAAALTALLGTAALWRAERSVSTRTLPTE